MSHIVLMIAIDIVIVVLVYRAWDQRQFKKKHVAIDGIIVEYYPLSPDAPSGTGPSAKIHLPDGRDGLLRFSNSQQPLVPGQIIALWQNTTNGSIVQRF